MNISKGGWNQVTSCQDYDTTKWKPHEI